jgi:hypothetical protein
MGGLNEKQSMDLGTKVLASSFTFFDYGTIVDTSTEALPAYFAKIGSVFAYAFTASSTFGVNIGAASAAQIWTVPSTTVSFLTPGSLHADLNNNQFIGIDALSVVAINPTTGAVNWTFVLSVTGTLYSGASFLVSTIPGVVVVAVPYEDLTPTGRCILFGLNAATGAQLWSSDVPFSFTIPGGYTTAGIPTRNVGSPLMRLINDGTNVYLLASVLIYANAPPGLFTFCPFVSSFNIESGSLNWQQSFNIAVNPHTGNTLSPTVINSVGATNALYNNNNMVFSVDGTKLYCAMQGYDGLSVILQSVNVSNGSLNSAITLLASTPGILAGSDFNCVDVNNIYYFDNYATGNLYATSLSGSGNVWSAPMQTVTGSSHPYPISDNNNVYYLSGTAFGGGSGVQMCVTPKATGVTSVYSSSSFKNVSLLTGDISIPQVLFFAVDLSGDIHPIGFR